MVLDKDIRNYCFCSPDYIENTESVSVISFYRKDFSPYLPIDMLQFYLKKHQHFKDRILFELIFGCIDINLATGAKNIISLNKAEMNLFKYQAKKFYYDNYDIFYYTYECDGLHIVWIENTETLINKTRLIDKYNYKGIFIRDVPLALDGNWEAIYNIKHT